MAPFRGSCVLSGRDGKMQLWETSVSSSFFLHLGSMVLCEISVSSNFFLHLGSMVFCETSVSSRFFLHLGSMVCSPFMIVVRLLHALYEPCKMCT